ncbi:MAG: trypsin-like peptidase domain-containing protein, partial [Planctomycetales bacterium]|nr:trypsin-like peptidase domain-containing protein [Planctomycetales bacterium]
MHRLSTIASSFSLLANPSAFTWTTLYAALLWSLALWSTAYAQFSGQGIQSGPQVARTGSTLESAALSGELLPEERVSIAVYDHCNRGVVHIATKSVGMDSFLRVAVSEGSGSGSVLDNTGLILTNQHVIDGAREISVSLYNGLSYPAELVGEDSHTDIAILKIDADKQHLFPIVWGDSQSLRVGQRVYAIGNPFGLERSMSKGMISSLNRQIPSEQHRTMRS